MFLRIRRPFLALTAALTLALPRGFAENGSPYITKPEPELLYERANDYVNNITEGDYSYAYMQFYWKRAQANLERAARVYPDSDIGRKLRADQVKVGPFALDYFKNRVLPRLEEKRLAAYDAVNCSIFLYNRDEQRWDDVRLAAMQSIVEVLCRQQRWNEALAFPVRDEDRPLFFSTIFRVAARYQQDKVVADILKRVRKSDRVQLWPILGEAMALNGTPRTDIAKFLDQHPEPEVKLAVLSGMIDREIGIQRAATLRLAAKNGVQMVHYSLLKPEVRDDVDAVARTFFPEPTPDADMLLAKYHASRGEMPASNAQVAVHRAYLEHLAVTGKYDELARYVSGLRITGGDRRELGLTLIELYAESGRDREVGMLRENYDAAGAKWSDSAALAAFRGRMNSIDFPLTVRDRTFSDLHLKDPCVLAQVIMEWSLTPNRSIRGAAPWDSVVQEYLPGFDNLPLPKSKAVQEASGASKPF